MAERGGGRVGDAGGRGTSSGDHAAVDGAEHAEHTPLFSGYDHGEVYQGENEDKRLLATLLSDPEPPEPLKPTAARDTVEDVNTEPQTENEVTLLPNTAKSVVAVPDHDVRWTDILDREGGMVMMPLSMIVVEVENEQPQPAPGVLDAFLHEGKWDLALRVLAPMVFRGEAVNGAVEGAPGHDIYKAHPALVLWLRGQAYSDMWRQGCTTASKVYYRDYIAALYPDGSSTGSIFADNYIMPSIRKLENTGSALRGYDTFVDGEKTCKCVQDYLKVYFPAYRPQLSERDIRVWEFGEKDGSTVRCLPAWYATRNTEA